MSPGSGNATTAATELPPLQNIDENWEKALAVVAHPDDLEYSAAAAIARWTSQGKTITYCMATSGEAGIDDMMPKDAGPLREREQRAAAKVVGVSDVWFLGHPDGVVEYGLPLRRDIARAIRQARPTIVITGNFHDANAFGTLNQADHIATGRAVIDAIRDAGNRWLFPELLDEGLEPWGSVRAVFVAGSPIAGHGVDVTDTLALGIASLKAHSQYLAGLGDGAADRTEVMLTMMARRTGVRLGVSHATDFEVLSFSPASVPAEDDLGPT
jgi:LmbE family N-acetylglucosaminyl deacetylase